MRARLNRVIKQIRASEEKEDDAYIRLIKKLAIEEKIEFDAAAVLIREYRKGGLIHCGISFTGNRLAFMNTIVVPPLSMPIVSFVRFRLFL